MADLSIDIQVTGAQTAASDLEEVGSAAESAGKKASGAAGGFKAIGTAVAGIGLITSGIFGLVDAQDDLTRSENTASRARRRASEATEKRVKAEKALADAMSGSGAQMELQIPAGKEFVQMWGDTAVQVRNTNGELSVIPATYKQVGGATKSLTQLQDELADARENERIQIERATVATNADTKAHQRQGIQYAKDIGQIVAGAGMFAPWVSGIADIAMKSPKAASGLGKIAGAAGVGFGIVGGGLALFELGQSIDAIAKGDAPKAAKHTKNILEILGEFGTGAAAAVPDLLDSIGLNIENMVDAVEKGEDPMKKFNEKFAFLGDTIAGKGFADLAKGVEGAATATFKWAVESVWPPVSEFLQSIPQNLMNLAVAATAFFTWVGESIWDFVTITVPNTLKELAVAATAFFTWAAESIWNFVTITVPQTLKELQVAATAFFTWAAESIWSFITITVPEALKSIYVAATAFVTWVAEQVWQFFTVTVPEALKSIAVAATAFVTWVVQQVWQFFTVTVPEALKSVAVAATAFVTWAVQQVWSFFTVTVPEALKSLALNSVAAVTWAVQQVWGFFTITVPEALKGLALNSVAAVTWAVTQVWGFFTVTVPEALKAIAVAALATVTWGVTQIWTLATVTVPDYLKNVAVDALATITWTAKNIWPQGSILDQLFGGGAPPKLDMSGTVTLNANDQATSTINTVKSNLESIKDKNATVTVSVTGGASSAIANIGVFKSRFARHGMDEVISQPTNLRVGEGFHPELVTVTPLGKTGGGGTGTAAHPHAATGGSFISGLGSMIAGIMSSAVNAAAQDIKTETQKVEDQKHLMVMDRYNMLVRDAQTDIRKIADSIVYIQKALASGAGNPDNNPAVTARFVQDLQEANRDYARAVARLGTITSNKPEQPKVSVEVTGAAKGFGPAMVRKPTVFMAGEAGPEMVNVVPMARGTRSRGSNGSLARVEQLLEALVRRQSSRANMMEANLIVDGQRMANVSQKYIGTKSYGDR